MKNTFRAQLVMALSLGILALGIARVVNGQIFDPSVEYAVDDNPASITLADLDGDADHDLATANVLSDNISVVFNNGDGTFGAATNYDVGDDPVCVAAADLDGDGDQDLAVANIGGNDVSVLLNNGDGTFVLDASYPAVDAPWFVVAADLDGDTDHDLATADGGSHAVSILLNNGDGTFAPFVNYGTDGNAPYSLAASDLDGDGDPDLVTANSLSDDLSVLLNHGDGTFALAVTYGAGERPLSVAATDLDGDGDPDLAAANWRSNDVFVLLNNGDAVFAFDARYDVGDEPNFAADVDLDGDGDADLAVVNGNSDNISVLLNNGNATFVFDANYSVESYPRSVAATDLDSDGDYDLAVANSTSDNVSILLNRLGPFAVRCATFGELGQTISEADIDNNGVRNGLQAKANNAKKQFERGKLKTSGNVLCALLHEVDAQNGKHINPASAQDIRGCVISLAETLDIPLPCESEAPVAPNTVCSSPNPFRSATTIAYEVRCRNESWGNGRYPHNHSRSRMQAEERKVVIGIYDMTGREIKTLVDKQQKPGIYSVEWDARDRKGQNVPSGIYFCRFQGEEYVTTHKVILLK